MSIAIVACGALESHLVSISKRTGLDIAIYPLPAILHNTPKKIASEVNAILTSIADQYTKCAVAYADCGTYGALDEVIMKHGVSRLGGSHCYDVFAGRSEIERIMNSEPGTYFLTDFLARTFYQSVVVELGLDRYPHLRDDYFQNYRKVVWLAQNPRDELELLARSAADIIGLPLEIIFVGEANLEREILTLVQQ
jgi:hypothetical protein